MTPQIDAGAIAYSDTFPLGEADTALTVMTRCVHRGIRLMEQLIEAAENGDPIPARPQDLVRRKWYVAGPPEGGRLNWNNPAREIANFVRACDYRPFPSPWGFPRCRSDAGELRIVKARAMEEAAGAPVGTVADATDDAVVVAASDRWVWVEYVEVNGRVCRAAEILRTGAVLE
jgi:methionyl-tRNA formyltransferase